MNNLDKNFINTLIDMQQSITFMTEEIIKEETDINEAHLASLKTLKVNLSKLHISINK